MISVPLARKLRDGGLRWEPVAGDRFVVADRDMDDDVFTVADMMAEVHEFDTGRVIGFNGTVEWALDSIEAHNSVWLPNETQLRERLGGTFRALTHGEDGWRVDLVVAGRDVHVVDADAGEAYGRALLLLVTGEAS